MALIGEMQYLTIGGNTYSLPVGGGGTVTSIAVSNATNGGLSVFGSPISSSGTITIGHSNVLAAAQTTQAVYPITIDKNGHISGYGTAVTIPDISGKVNIEETNDDVTTNVIRENGGVELQAWGDGASTALGIYPGVISLDTEIDSGGYPGIYLSKANREIVFQRGTIKYAPTGSNYIYTITGTPTVGRTITLPDKDGTIALTSDISTITNSYSNDAKSGNIMLNDSNTSSSTLSSTKTSGALTFSTSGVLQIGKAHSSEGSKGSINLSNSASSNLNYTTIVPSGTAARTITLPNATGTVALTSDILQSDWNQTTSTAKDYIKNKPTIPTKVSDLTNDSGFITGYTETDPTVPSWAKASSKPSYNFSEIGSIPTSISGYGITDAYTKSEVDGLVSGVLHYKGTKATVSALPSSGNTTGDVWHVTADGSEWAWDGTTWQELGTAVDLSGYVPTSRTINSKALTGNISLTASDVGALPSSTTIPSKTSDLTNDSGFVTTDEKLKTPVIGEDVGFRYFVLTTSSDSAETKIRSTGDLRYSLDEDSTLEIGSAYVPSKLVLHSGKGYSASTTLLSNELLSSVKITFPSTTGTVALTSDIPTKTSDLTNDSGFTTAQIIRWTESA